MRFIIITACTYIAYCRASHVSLARYFGAQFVVSVLGEWFLLNFGVSSRTYAAAYIAGEAVVFLSMIPLVYSALYCHHSRGLAVLFGMFVAAMLAWESTWGHRIGFYGCIGMIDGALLVAYAIPTGLGAAYLKGNAKKIALSLMVMWMALAVFHFGFTANFDSPLWATLNDTVPTMLVAAGCLWLSMLDRRERPFKFFLTGECR